MSNDKASEFRRFAADCRAHAARAQNEEVGRQFLELARAWDDMAGRAEKFQAELAQLIQTVTSTP